MGTSPSTAGADGSVSSSGTSSRSDKSDPPRNPDRRRRSPGAGLRTRLRPPPSPSTGAAPSSVSTAIPNSAGSGSPGSRGTLPVNQSDGIRPGCAFATTSTSKRGVSSGRLIWKRKSCSSALKALPEAAASKKPGGALRCVRSRTEAMTSRAFDRASAANLGPPSMTVSLKTSATPRLRPRIRPNTVDGGSSTSPPTERTSVKQAHSAKSRGRVPIWHWRGP